MARAQAHALEAFVAATVLLASVTFALQVTAVTPLTASTSSQHIENQQSAITEGLLAAAAENGTLKRTALLTYPQNGTFRDADAEGYYIDGGPPTAFGEMLNQTFLANGIAFNVYVNYLRDSEARRTIRMVYMGQPSDHAISQTRFLTLYDNDTLYAPDGSGSTVAQSETLGEVDAGSETMFYTPDADPGTLYGVIEVEVVVWRM
ncbi:hypothetical protein [Haloferax sp. DFSO60]|uniref:DUF7288 family protein n=1 Tax=Haloferax sp. DFSO60 TaxID=3388652 RepID=UPI00397852F4